VSAVSAVSTISAKSRQFLDWPPERVDELAASDCIFVFDVLHKKRRVQPVRNYASVITAAADSMILTNRAGISQA